MINRFVLNKIFHYKAGAIKEIVTKKEENIKQLYRILL